MDIIVYVDGLCEPVNPGGIACYGYVIYVNGVKMVEDCGVIDHPDPSNNVAEYMACIKAVEKLDELGLRNEHVTVKGDSQLLIFQLNGFYSVRSGRILPLYEEAVNVIKKFKHIRFEWIPREENVEADELSRKAYHEHVAKNIEVFLKKYQSYLATEKQKTFLKQLKIPYPPWISKREASVLISESIKTISSKPSQVRGKKFTVEPDNTATQQ